MKHMTKAGAAALITLFAGVAQANEQVLHYEPAVVGLVGTIRMERHYGPPNFGQTPHRDMVENVPVLILDTPVTVQGNPSSPMDGDSFSHVSRIQLVIAKPGATDLSAYFGKPILATGRLFEKVSGENFTNVLLDVQRIGPASGVR